MAIRRLEIAAALILALAGSAEAEGRYGLGRPASEAEIAAWNIDIDRDGKKLPAGSGSVAHGREVFGAQCASCHGEKGEGGLGDKLVGEKVRSPRPSR